MIFFAIFSMMVLLAGYICAKGIFLIFKLTWLSVLAMLLTITVPLSIYIWMADIVRCFGHIYCGFLLYFSICCASILVAYKLKPKLKYRRFLKYSLPAVIALLVLGYINAIHPRLKEIRIPSDSTAKICFISDMHVGSISTPNMLNRIANLINEANPDIVILGGDTLDLNATKKYRNEFIQTFAQITKKFRTIAVIGNHEIYSGLRENVKLLQDAGIEVLLDRAISFEDFTIIGRLDRSIAQRNQISDLIITNGKKTIVVDHQPNDIPNIVKHNAFLYLAGHTHGGQVFPFNFVIDLMYSKTGALQKFKNSYVYISSGAGFWGPPFRIGSMPEVVLIRLEN